MNVLRASLRPLLPSVLAVLAAVPLLFLWARPAAPLPSGQDNPNVPHVPLVGYQLETGPRIELRQHFDPFAFPWHVVRARYSIDGVDVYSGQPTDDTTV